MGIEAENTMAQKDAAERKPTEHERDLAMRFVNKLQINREDSAGLANLLAEHRCETKRIVLEEQGIDNGQDLEKRAVLSKRIVQLEAELSALKAEKDRLAKTLGYKMLEVRVNNETPPEGSITLYSSPGYCFPSTIQLCDPATNTPIGFPYKPNPNALYQISIREIVAPADVRKVSDVSSYLVHK